MGSGIYKKTDLDPLRKAGFTFDEDEKTSTEPKPVTKMVSFETSEGPFVDRGNVPPEVKSQNGEVINEEQKPSEIIMPGDIPAPMRQERPQLFDSVLTGRGPTPQQMIAAGREYEAARDDYTDALIAVEAAEEALLDADARARIVGLKGTNDKQREASARQVCALEIANKHAARRFKIQAESRLRKAEKRVILLQTLLNVGYVDVGGEAEDSKEGDAEDDPHDP
jgi:hypothetical protein